MGTRLTSPAPSARSTAAPVPYLKAIAPDTQAIALVHALEVGVTELALRRERFQR